jgi:hypothetical protein
MPCSHVGLPLLQPCTRSVSPPTKVLFLAPNISGQKFLATTQTHTIYICWALRTVTCGALRMLLLRKWNSPCPSSIRHQRSPLKKTPRFILLSTYSQATSPPHAKRSGSLTAWYMAHPCMFHQLYAHTHVRSKRIALWHNTELSNYIHALPFLPKTKNAGLIQLWLTSQLVHSCKLHSLIIHPCDIEISFYFEEEQGIESQPILPLAPFAGEVEPQ